MTKRKPGAKKGRPTKKTPTRVQILLKALKEGMPLDRACDIAMLARNTVYNWIREDPDFCTQIRYARAFAVNNLIRMCKMKDSWKILKSLDPKNFSDTMVFRDEEEERDEDMAGKSDEEIKEGAK